ncbi:MAG: alpha-glucan family phosphorylase [Bacteroidales bacterium]
MTKKYIKPDYLFEVSWEVCNKVGGIYTVLSSKYKSMANHLGDQYIFIGPDVWKETVENPDFLEDRTLYKAWTDSASKEGLRIRTGRWNIPGRPVAVLVDFTTFFTQKDEIFAKFWETYKLDSLTGGWDYIEPALFGYAAGKVIESLYNFHLSAIDKIIAHFHEWMTGSGILYLKENTPQIGTVFTTHATSLGRSIAGNNMRLYSELERFNPGELAKQLGIASKYSLEYNTAKEADCFTTVSDITANECKYLLKRDVDVVTPNGFSDVFHPDRKELDALRKTARKKIITVAEALLNQKIEKDALLVLSSGRYEFRNKGLDVFIDALGKLNKDANNKKQVVALITIPSSHAGPRKELQQRIGKPDYSNPVCDDYITHVLYDRIHDPILNRVKEQKLTNGPEQLVKVVFVPVYLNGTDGIFNLDYYQLLNGFDLTLFPSYYEPWGYTPLESIAFGIPTLTTSLAGFGLWVRSNVDVKHHAVETIERTEDNYLEVVDSIEKELLFFATADPQQLKASRKESFEISALLHWDLLSDHYREAYAIAARKVEERSDLFKGKQSIEYTVFVNGKNETPDWKKIYVKAKIPKVLEPLRELSMNLWWSWNYEAIELFQNIDDDLWTATGHNPIAVLNGLSFEKMESLKGDVPFMDKMKRVYSSFKNYMKEAADKPDEQVAYFSMEFGLHESVKIYSGGLGILAGDYLKQASDSNKNMVGVGLLYRYGYFNQSLSLFGDQIAQAIPQKFTELPLEPVRNKEGNWVMVNLALPGRNLTAKVWKLQVGRIPLYLLDADIEENTAEDRSVTHNLYGGDWYNRFKQEILLGVGGIRMLFSMGINPDVFHLNEGHAAFAGLERLRWLVDEKGFNFKTAKEIVRASSLFTTHTPVPAGHDTFSEDILRMYIPHYANRLNISWDEFMDLGRFQKGNANEKFSMSVLAANLSQEMNGVSKIHGRVSREMFCGLYPSYFPEELFISHVTNGVHLPTWTNKNWQQFYSSNLGNDLVEQQSNPMYWNKIQTLPNEVVWQERKKAKAVFVDFLAEKLQEDLTKRQENPKIIFKTLDYIVEDALYIGFARRFATYKRAHLLFSNLERLALLLNDSEKPLRFVFAGKAHPNDGPGQDLIKRVIEISKMPQFIGKVIFLENYDMHVGRHLVSGVDIWLNTPTRPLEASGTSGEKAVMNGVMNFSVLDGWWAEGYRQNAGWAIQEARTYGNQAFQDELDAETIYQLIEDEILPMYFNTNEQGVSDSWVAHIKNTISSIVPHFTMKRMLDDYYNQFYNKLFERHNALKQDNYQPAKAIRRWKEHMVENWEKVDVISVRIPDSSASPLDLGDEFAVEIVLNTHDIAAENIGIDLVIGQKVNDRVTEIFQKEELRLVKKSGVKATYSTSKKMKVSGVFDFAFRIFPKADFLPHRQDFNLVKWI